MNGNRRLDEQENGGFMKGAALAAAGVIAALAIGVFVFGGQESTSSKPAKSVATHRDVEREQPVAGTDVEPPPVETVAAVAQDIAPEPAVPATWDEAQAAWDAGQWSLAADAFASYSATHDGNAWGHFMTGLALRQDGRFGEAEAALQRCLAIDPRHEKALIALARVRLSLDRAGDALEPIRTAVAQEPGNVDAQRVLGRVLHTLGCVDDAEQAYLTALAIDPQDAWANNNLGLLRIEGERFAEAVEPLQRACAAGAGQAVFFNNLGVALERIGQYRSAGQAYAHALELSPGEAKAAVSLARVSALGGPMDDPVGTVADASEADADSSLGDAMVLADPEVPVDAER